MAGKTPEDADEDFSVILGTRKSGSEKKGRQPAAPAKPKELPKNIIKPEKKKMTLEELLGKKEELEIFLNSIHEARNNSKFPAYSYEKLKSKAERELSEVKERIKESAYPDAKKEAENVNADIEELKTSIMSMKNRRVVKTDYEQSPDPKNASIDELEKEISELSRKLETLYKRLNAKIDDVSVEEDAIITENVKQIMGEIKAIKASLSGFVKKAELKDILIRSPAVIKHAGRAPAARRMKPIPRHVVRIRDLSKHKGRDVMLDCTIIPFKFLKKGKTQIYWYKILDGSGRSILTSYSKIKPEKAKIIGSVRKTKDGSLYVLFRELA